MSERSLSDVSLVLGSTTYTLRGSMVAYHRLEREMDIPWFQVVQKTAAQMQIQQVAEFICALAVDNHPDLKPDDVVKSMGDLSGFRRAVDAVREAVALSIPAPTEADLERMRAAAEAAEKGGESATNANPTRP